VLRPTRIRLVLRAAARAAGAARRSVRAWSTAAARAGLLAALLLSGCSRPIDRPLEGAAPARAAEAGASQGAAVQPALTASQTERAAPPSPEPAAVASPSPPAAAVVAGPSPAPLATASPVPPGRNPILGQLQPANQAVVPPGPVTIRARVSTTADLAEVVLTLNGAPVQPSVTQQEAGVWFVTYATGLTAGSYRAHLTARDQHGRAGGFGWQFEVAGAPRASPAAISPPR
jgi:hypothetical protein